MTAEEAILLAARTGCLLWYGSIAETSDGQLSWYIQVPDEKAALRTFPIAVNADESFMDAFIAARLEDDAARMDLQCASEIRAGRDFRNEFRYRTRDGRIRWASAEVAVTTVSPGNWQIAGICIDVTAHNEAEDALRASEIRFRQAFDNAPIGMAIGDLNHRVIEANRALCQMLGYTADEMSSMACNDFLHPDDSTASAEQLRHMLRGNISSFTMKKRYLTKSGETVWVNVMMALVHDSMQQPLYVLAMVENLTEQKRAAERQALLASIVESAIDPIAAHSWDGMITSWNTAAERLFGYSADEVLGKHVSLISHPSSRAATLMRLERVRRGEPTELCESVAVHKDGHSIDVMIRVSPIKSTEGEIVGTSAALHDITDRKQTQREMDEQLAQLSALRAIDNAIIGSIDLRLMAEEIVKQVCATLNVDAADIFVLNPGLKVLEFAAAHGFRTPEAFRANLQIGDGVSGKTVLTRQPVLIPILADANDRLQRRQLPESEGFVGYAVIPLVAKGQVAGVLEVFNRAPLEFSAKQWQFLKDLAAQAAIAIDNARMFERLQRSNIELMLAYDATIEGWSHAMDLRDHDTEGHSIRAADLTLCIARAIGVPDDQMIHIRRGSLLHDIGKLAIPDRVLLKDGPLDKVEWEIMKMHPVYAFEMLAPIDFLRPASDIPYCHHEKWDGTGYPQGLKGEEIPLAARIFAVVDVWDALLTDRPYRPAWSRDRALDWIVRSSGTHFDPRVVAAFVPLNSVER